MAPRAFVGVPALVALLLLSSPAVASCATHHGAIIAPAGPPVAVLFADHGITAFYVPAGGSYSLAAVAPVQTHCPVASSCFATPDFNIAFYADSEPFDTMVTNHNQIGNQAGAIPAEADYGIVYMRYGPDVPNGDSSLLGAEFVYTVC